jgi:cardiolipin synthase (CMP-forming)
VNLPNLITLFRILITPLFFTELVSYKPGQEHHRWIAFWLFIAGIISDAADGLIARVTKNQTPLGRFLDPLADKLLLLSGFLGILFVEPLPYHPPVWVTVAIVFRDIFLVGGLIVVVLMYGKVHVKPNFLGKVTTVAQMATLTAILLGLNVSVLLWNITGVLTILSCLYYLVRDLPTSRSKFE